VHVILIARVRSASAPMWRRRLPRKLSCVEQKTGKGFYPKRPKLPIAGPPDNGRARSGKPAPSKRGSPFVARLSTDHKVPVDRDLALTIPITRSRSTTPPAPPLPLWGGAGLRPCATR
jgi:hypothetical protein